MSAVHAASHDMPRADIFSGSTMPAPLTELRRPPAPYLAVPYPDAYRTISSVPVGYVSRPGFVVYPALQPWWVGRVPALFGWRWPGAWSSARSRSRSSLTIRT